MIPVIVLAACSGPLGCSKRQAPTSDVPRVSTSEASPEPIRSTPQPSPVEIATPDPLAGRRAQLATHIGALTDSECDALVLRFQLIPRDEVLDPISKPRSELLRYVRRIASVEDLDAVERAINEHRRQQTL